MKLREIPRIDLTEKGYRDLIDSSEILLEESQGPKVCRSASGDVVKFFFRRKRLVSSNLWNPYALRFARNSLALAHMEIPAARVTAWGRVPHLRQHYVRYGFLTGTTIRSALDSSESRDGEALACSLAVALARLHKQGVLFRAGHLGNFLLRPNGTLALIDIENLSCYPHPLSLGQRARNFGHLLRYPRDRFLIWDRYREGFWRSYCDAAALDSANRTQLKTRIERTLAAGASPSG